MTPRLALLLTFLTVAFFGAPSGRAQEQGAIIDSVFEARITQAWDEIRPAYDDSTQHAFADTLFQYYLHHPDTQTGWRAVSNAFVMWGNAGAADEVDAALPHIRLDSPNWGRLLGGIANAYLRHGQRTRDDYIVLLRRLNREVTHPRSRSAVLMELARYYQELGDAENAELLYQEVVDLDAHALYAKQAASYLYELNALNVGQPAPDFTAATLAGDSLSLADLRGKVVLLEFWATWCGPCHPEIPHLKQIQATYAGEDFQLIGIALDDDLEELEHFIEQEDMTWPQIQQAERWAGEVARLFNVNGIPRSYLIDRTGTIAAKDLRKEKLEATIAELVGAAQE